MQDRFVATDWAGAPTTGVATVLANTAWASHAQWPTLGNALANAYAWRCDDDIESYLFDRTSCWKGDAGVDAAIGAALRKAQVATAAFLYAAELP